MPDASSKNVVSLVGSLMDVWNARYALYSALRRAYAMTPSTPTSRGTRHLFIPIMMLLTLVSLLSAGCSSGVGDSSAPTPTATTPPTATATTMPTPTLTATPTPLPALGPVARPWVVSTVGNSLNISYVLRDGTAPQFGVLDLASSYLRLNTGLPNSWGTSIILLPAFWLKTDKVCRDAQHNTATMYCQGAAVKAQTHSAGDVLVIDITGVIGGLSVKTRLVLDPPTASNPSVVTPVSMHAHVTATTTGQVALDTTRTNEIFKPVMLSSMHASSTQWDASAATAGEQTYQIPSTGWIIYPATTATTFGLVGGHSAWKANAPTVAITLDSVMGITGKVDGDTNPNDESVGFWAASDHALPGWSYDITVSPAT